MACARSGRMSVEAGRLEQRRENEGRLGRRAEKRHALGGGTTARRVQDGVLVTRTRVAHTERLRTAQQGFFRENVVSDSHETECSHWQTCTIRCCMRRSALLVGQYPLPHVVQRHENEPMAFMKNAS